MSGEAWLVGEWRGEARGECIRSSIYEMRINCRERISARQYKSGSILGILLGERERAHLVLRLGRAVYIYIYIYTSK